MQVRVNTRLKVNRYISKKLQAERDAAAAAGTPNLELPNAPGVAQGLRLDIDRSLCGPVDRSVGSMFVFDFISYSLRLQQQP